MNNLKTKQKVVDVMSYETEKRQEEEYFERCFQITLDAPKRIFHLDCFLYETHLVFIFPLSHLFIHSNEKYKSNLDLKNIPSFCSTKLKHFQIFSFLFHFHHHHLTGWMKAEKKLFTFRLLTSWTAVKWHFCSHSFSCTFLLFF